MSTDQQHTEILKRVAQGDQAALGELYDHTSPLVYSLALRILRDKSAAEEVTLDLFLHVWSNAETFDRSRGNLRGWLTVMARSRALDRLRVLRREGKVVDLHVDLDDRQPVGDDDTPEIAYQRGEVRSRVQDALAKLPTVERRAVECAFIDGLSHPQVASALEIPLGTAKSRIRQGLRKLRRLLDQDSSQRKEVLTRPVSPPERTPDPDVGLSAIPPVRCYGS